MVVKKAIEADYTRRLRRSWVGRCDVDCGFEACQGDLSNAKEILSFVACRNLLK